MKKLFLIYLLLINFCYLFYGVLWGNHVHHDHSFSYYSCSNFEHTINTKTKNGFCVYCISESSIEHLFENGVVIENTKIKYLSKFNNDYFPYFYLATENYQISYEIQKSNFIAEINIPKEILLFKETSPRSPPVYS